MLKLDIDKHCRLRNFDNSAAFLRKEGFTHWTSNSLLRKDMMSIKLDDIERLCNVFKCTPNDLFEWVPDNASDAKNENHHLSSLKKDKNVEKGINQLTFAQLKEIADIMNKKK